MNTYVLAISRLTPTILWISFFLIAARYLYNLLRARGYAIGGRAAFVVVLLIGTLTTFVFLWRLEMLVSASLALRHEDWPRVDTEYRRYEASGGHINAPMSIDWANALLQQRRFRDAEEVLFEGAGGRANNVHFSRDAVLLVGECWYYEGRFREAEGAFRAAAGATNEFLRNYFLGRIAERRGDVVTARQMEDAALRIEPSFFPAFYASTRLALLAGERELALQRLHDFQSRFPTAARNPLFAPLMAAAEGRGPVPQDVEFFVVTS